MKLIENKRRGIVAGLVCFGILMLIWAFPIFSSLFIAPEALQNDVLGNFAISFVIVIIVSAFFGFSIATKSKMLKASASLLLLALFIYWFAF
jgi:hypothetical protein